MERLSLGAILTFNIKGKNKQHLRKVIEEVKVGLETAGCKGLTVLLPVISKFVFCTATLLANFAYAQEVAQRLYAEYSESVYKIEVITPGLEKKSSVGTGFVVGREDIIASNFHVVSDAVNEPSQYKLEWQNALGERGPLRVIAVDVVRDLSILKAEQSLGRPFETTTLPDKGSALYSLGHPLDLDLSIVAGTANGLLENSVYEKIHFSGGINSGMSGGPTLNADGKVVGVNVASAGNSVGFLVPGHYLDVLLQKTRDNNFAAETDLIKSIGQQLHASQAALFGEFLHDEWPVQQVGPFEVPGTISQRLSCWGDNEPENETRKHRSISSICSGQDSIFLSGRQRAGIISYEFFWLDSKSLSNRSFYWMYQNHHNSSFFPGATERDVGNFSCSTKFINLSGQDFKTNVCARPYKRFPGLVDFMVLMAMVGHEKEGFIFTLDLATVTLENGMSIFERFMESFNYREDSWRELSWKE